jgi:fumarate reductase subunit C
MTQPAQAPHGKPYSPAFPKTWWLKSGFYTRYMIREASSFFVGSYCALLIVGLWQLSQGPLAWAGFLSLLQSPGSIVYHALALAFTLYHTITWFAVTPQTMPILKGEEFVPHLPIVIAQYVGWFGASLIVLLAAIWL